MRNLFRWLSYLEAVQWGLLMHMTHPYQDVGRPFINRVTCTIP